MQRIPSRLAVIGFSTLTAAAMLAACNRADDRTAGQKVDATVAQAGTAMERAGDKMANAANKTADKAKDMAITAEMKTKLAADDRLKATSINVDTDNGAVTLRGTAPDAAAKESATAMAQSLSGVTKVDNQLTVK